MSFYNIYFAFVGLLCLQIASSGSVRKPQPRFDPNAVAIQIPITQTTVNNAAKVCLTAANDAYNIAVNEGNAAVNAATLFVNNTWKIDTDILNGLAAGKPNAKQCFNPPYPDKDPYNANITACNTNNLQKIKGITDQLAANCSTLNTTVQNLPDKFKNCGTDVCSWACLMVVNVEASQYNVKLPDMMAKMTAASTAKIVDLKISTTNCINAARDSFNEKRIKEYNRIYNCIILS